MRGHGGVVAGGQLISTALIAISLQANAALQSKAMAMGDVQYLSDGEIARGTERPARKGGGNKIWDYHCRRAGL
jgi:HCOMODA/2-hydroxy-3-carboxy-muconic semialdehyde decarboxylase